MSGPFTHLQAYCIRRIQMRVLGLPEYLRRSYGYDVEVEEPDDYGNFRSNREPLWRRSQGQGRGGGGDYYGGGQNQGGGSPYGYYNPYSTHLRAYLLNRFTSDIDAGQCLGTAISSDTGPGTGWMRPPGHPRRKTCS